MMKEVGYKQNWGEEAPSLLINPRKSSACPRLETILEEGYENHAVFSKKLLVVLPLVLSTAVYFLLNKDLTLCA
ncbi:LEM3 (ligand-effect modulator 3) family protein / CDC50 family protein isoform 1 [Hibiscus syriacus]|uniref:LEM3 (Ligand-effect modulator 3) family protein / CDC50 family protein isoform 1 n=2 Tax=Hibiscus syriacus TaxID=106335 RepID=A0A6A3BEL3_HIBSY|nr:LEM3 (ligand-effect modulator 3) family protein / CDC50 family protein isoform 1 [Hibiscus syriacus]